MNPMILEVADIYVESCAYHEAGHIVIAAVQAIPLRQRGIRIDEVGNGLACYHFRVPDGSSNLGRNEEREKTIRATKAGYLAQKKFYPECRPASAHFDVDAVRKLLDEMYPGSASFDAHTRLHAEAITLIEEHWDAIKATGEALWSKEWKYQALAERRWSLQLREKSIEGPEILSLLKRFNIAANIQ
jgi:hypothetical protein